jgi:tRNA modification GTPase
VSLVYETDTIAAIATPAGEGSISVIRLSGPEAILIAAKGFRGKDKLGSVPSHSAHHGDFVDHSGQLIDDVIALVFRAPHSYTGEDVVELSCHGGAFVSRKLLEATINAGARAAQPGEFTRRAFLNGKMDLAQAEAVADLIRTRSEAGHRSSVHQLQGLLSKEINSIRDQLVKLIGSLELELDFAEDGYEFAEKSTLDSQIRSTISEIERLLASYETGRIYREGVRVVLAGPPNVGKSSLLNALLMQDRAIVTEIPGTTRDTIEESVILDGALFSITDTAGLRETTDPVEVEGVRRSESELFNSDVLLLMFDCSRDLSAAEEAYVNRLASGIQASRAPCLRVFNKLDLGDLNDKLVSKTQELLPGSPAIAISAKTMAGLDELKSLLARTVLSGKGNSGEGGATITSARHQSALLAGKESLELALDSLAQRQSGEFIVLDLRRALDHLGLITGAVTTDDILNDIFSKFCIGK